MELNISQFWKSRLIGVMTRWSNERSRGRLIGYGLSVAIGGKADIPGPAGWFDPVASDPTRTSTSGACCSREADFYPYQTTCMRRTMRHLACRLDPSTTHIS